MKKVFGEALLIALAGVLIAFAANALSPRGLRLTRNYFPPSPATVLTTNSVSGQTNSPNLAERLRAEGLQLADLQQASTLFHEPRRENGGVLFIDARNEDEYQRAHVPGAYLLDYYHPENYLGAVLPLCGSAQKIVVYCNGGDCEDSQLTAMLLKNAQIPGEKLLVYAGGITEWTNRGMPFEIGERNSGKVEQAKPPAPTSQ